jgi:hypothetical protein
MSDGQMPYCVGTALNVHLSKRVGPDRGGSWLSTSIRYTPEFCKSRCVCVGEANVLVGSEFTESFYVGIEPKSAPGCLERSLVH